MSAYSKGEFARLLAAHANRELSDEDLHRLGVMAGASAEQLRELREVGVLHDLLEQEQRLRQKVLRPAEPQEEADEVYRRLGRRAARAEQALRAMVADQGPPVVAPRWRRRALPRLLGAVAAAAVLLVTAYAVGVFSPAAPPEDRRLDAVPGIVLRPEITATSRQISWHAVIGARSYDATITDADDRTVLARPDEQARGTVWQLTEQEFTLLERHPQPLFLRVVARDGAGIRIVSTGDLQLQIR